jgi:hypothetical protein
VIGRAAIGLLLAGVALTAPAALAGDARQERPDAAADVHHDAWAETTVRTRGPALLFTGRISPESVARARGLLDASPQVREVVIESPGGDVGAGMDFGEMILARGLDVRVAGWGCMSSCANYVFPAGRRKTIEAGSLVLWHGSMLQEGLLESFDLSKVKRPFDRPLNRRERRMVLRTLRADFHFLSGRQERFYERLGVDAAITVIGQRQGCGCNWTLAVEDMAGFGLREVSAPADYAAPGYGVAPWDWQLVRASGGAGRG